MEIADDITVDLGDAGRCLVYIQEASAQATIMSRPVVYGIA